MHLKINDVVTEYSVARMVAKTASIVRGKAFFYTLLLIAILFFIWRAVVMNRPVVKPIFSIKISGLLQGEQRQKVVRAVIFPFVRTGFFWLNVHKIREQLLSLSWIRDATVQRLWPGTLKIHIFEQQPTAIWSKTQFLNAKGEIFEFKNVRPATRLPVLTGPEGSQHRVMEQYYAVSQLLKQVHLKINQLALTRRDMWLFRVGEVSFILGAENCAKKLHRFIRGYRVVLAHNWHKVRFVDLRYDNGFSVAWYGKTHQMRGGV